MEIEKHLALSRLYSSLAEVGLLGNLKEKDSQRNTDFKELIMTKGRVMGLLSSSCLPRKYICVGQFHTSHPIGAIAGYSVPQRCSGAYMHVYSAQYTHHRAIYCIPT